MKLDAASIARILHAPLAPDAPSLAPLGVSTDSRTIAPGDLFVALRGERFDGHAYVRAAVERGAACTLIEDPAAAVDGVPALLVADTKQAYMVLGALARARVRGPIVGITGSNGKSTTKGFLRDLLAGTGREVRATPENENNEIGVTKFFLGLDEGSEAICVVEMGCRHPGDIGALVDVARPHVGILTNVGEAHLGVMGSREAIADAKWELFSRGARAVLNLADAASRARRETLAEPPRYFHAGPDAVAEGDDTTIVRDPRTLEIHADGTVARYAIDAALPGLHNLANLAAAFAAARLLGAAPEALARAVPGLALPHGRYESLVVPGGARVIHDAYNASPTGTLATLRTFVAEPARRRVVVFGSMAELGEESAAMHREIGAVAAAGGIDVILAGGAYGDDVVRGAREAGGSAEIVRYRENREAVDWLRGHVREGDVVLLKGSRMYKMEEIVEALRGSAV